MLENFSKIQKFICFEKKVWKLPNYFSVVQARFVLLSNRILIKMNQKMTKISSFYDADYLMKDFLPYPKTHF